MVKRTCTVCSKKVNECDVRSSSKNKITNVILVASLAAIENLSGPVAKRIYEDCHKQRKCVCNRHFVRAAQYLCGEMASVGNNYTPLPYSTSGAYVTVKDIPEHLINIINAIAKRMDINAKVSVKDVWTFLNSAFARYYSSPLWLEHFEHNTWSQPIPASELCDSGEKVETSPGSPVGAEMLFLKRELEEDQGSSSPVDTHDFLCDPPDRDRSPAHPYNELTDPALLERYYLIKGSTLMELFRFCPSCGLKFDHSYLKAFGSRTVVSFSCANCREGALELDPCDQQAELDVKKEVVENQ